MIFERKRKTDLTVAILPMIDIAYIIITFLLVFGVFRGSDAALKLTLPKSVSADATKPQPVVVGVSKEGAFYLTGGAVSSGELEARLRTDLARHPDLPVVIKADEGVEYRYLVRAMDAVRSAGGWRMALAVEKAP